MMTADQKADIKQKKKELGTFMALDVLSKSEGGQKLLKALREEMRDGLSTLFSSYKTGNETKLRALIASVHERMKFYQSLTRAGHNARISKEDLEDMLKEIANDEPDDGSEAADSQ